MMRDMSRTHGVWAALVVCSFSALARADLPPPDGKKFVSYGFSVANLKSFPDYVLLAYPWSLSNGAPTKEHALVEEGKTVKMGRRSQTPKLWAMKRAEYEKWKASYQPTHEYQDPALDALFSGKQVIPCGIDLSPKTMIEKSDPRDEVVDALNVESIDASSCRVVLAGAAPAAKTGEPTAVPATPVASATATSPTAPSAEPKPRGCGACEVGTGSSDFVAWPGLVLGLLLWRRRRAAPKTRTPTSTSGWR